MPLITISSEFGAGGPTVGVQLAERLGVDYVDQDIVHQIALDLDVPKEKVKEFDEVRHSRLRGFLSTVFDFEALRGYTEKEDEESPGVGYDDREDIPYNYQVKGWIDRDIYKQMMMRVMTAIGERGGAVIKGRGSQWILRDNPNALHVRFVAELEDRVARTMERRGISRDEARKLIGEMDQRGENYVEAYFGRDLKDSLLYHVVLNTSRIPLDQCLELLEQLARREVPAPE
jgi:cytidylate kinase